MSALRKLTLAVVPLAIVAGVFVTAGRDAGATRSAAPLTRLLAENMHVDFTPLASPRDAVAKSDLVVRGTLAAVAPGVTAVYPDADVTRRAAQSYATFVVDVTEVLSGDAGQVTDGQVFVRVRRSPVVSLDDLAGLNTRPEVVLVLDDVTADVPHPTARVVRPAAIPADAPLFAAFTDGMWFQGDGDAAMHGVVAHADELAPAWRGVTTVDAFARAIAAATA